MKPSNKWLCLALPLIFLFQCSDDCTKDERCQLKPDSGLCYMAITKYYYDPVEKRCKTFVWGGCDGVVPFETLEDCQNRCQCQDPPQE